MQVAQRRLALGADGEASNAPIRLQLAWILATSSNDALRDGDDSLRVLRELPNDAAVHEVRAAALAELGRFDEAVTSAQAAWDGGARTERVRDALGRYRRNESVRTPAR